MGKEIILDDNLQQLTKEIIKLKSQNIENIFTIGQKLIEVKTTLKHGQFGKYLKENIDITQNTANKYMRVVEEFLNCSTTNNLESSKLIELLDVPKEHKENFINENDLKNMSCREIRNKIKELKKTIKEENKQNKKETQQQENKEDIFKEAFSKPSWEIEDDNEELEEMMRKFKEANKNKTLSIVTTESENKLLLKFYKVLLKNFHTDTSKEGSTEAIDLIMKLKESWQIK